MESFEPLKTVGHKKSLNIGLVKRNDYELIKDLAYFDFVNDDWI